MMHKLLSLTLTLGLAIAGLVTTQKVDLAQAQSTPVGSFQVINFPNPNTTEGTEFTADAVLSTNAGVTVDTVNFTIQYDTARLRLISVDQSNSVFPVAGSSLVINQDQGTISQLRGTANFTGYNGNSGRIIQMRFQSKATGGADFTYTSATRAYRNGSLVNLQLIKSTVTIVAPTPQPNGASIESFTIEPSRITRGESATVKWSTKDATEITLNGDKVSASGSKSVKPDVNTSYTLRAKNSVSEAVQAKTLEVNPPPPPVTTTPKPTSTARTTNRATTTPRTTASTTPRATSTPAPTPSASPDLSAISLTQSTVTYNTVTAVADGVDTITVTVVLRKDDGTVVTNVTPIVQGLREQGDVASPFVYDELTQSWVSQITSTEPGIVTARVLAADVPLSTQDLTFTEPGDDGTTTGETSSGSSFGIMIAIGLILLLLLLLLLFFLWRKLRDKDEDDGSTDDDPNAPAFPGDEKQEDKVSADDMIPAIPVPVEDKADEPEPEPVQEPEPAPAEEPQSDETVGHFNADQALQRSNDQPEEQKPDDDTIPL